MLEPMVNELIQTGIAVESDGAICIFNEKKPKDPPLMLRKSDGGFGYDTTDMAALNYRANKLDADRIIYVTGKEQEKHFK